MYDLIIIGAGPAGLSAAIYAVRQKLKTLVVSKDVGGQTNWSSNVENYPGFFMISGVSLAQTFQEHLEKYDLEVEEGEIVKNIEILDKGFLIKTETESWQAKGVIVATGKKSRTLNIPGENEFRNKGVAYCYICDGPLFYSKDIAIVGGGNSAMDAAIQMSKIAKSIKLITNNNELIGDEILKERVQKLENVKILYDTDIKEIKGSYMVEQAKIKHKGDDRDLKLQGVFIEIGLIPNSNLLKNIKKNDKSEITIDSMNRTNIPGVFAAGDVTDIPEKQIIIAAGEGAKATLSVVKYLTHLSTSQD